MTTDEITLDVPGGRPRRAYVATPPTPRPGPPGPGVVVLHEVPMGLTADIAGICERLAAHGYVAVAPDLLRSGGPRLACMARAMRELRSGARGPVHDAVDAAMAWLHARADVDPARTATIGFCMGAGFALLHAARTPALTVTSANYGDVPQDAAALEGICPVVASYGGRDRVYGPQAERLERHLDALGVEHDVAVYPQAGHSFMNPGSEDRTLARLLLHRVHMGYVHDASEDAWARTLAFFDAHLAAPAQVPSSP